MLGSLLGSLSGGLLANQGVLAEDANSAKSAGYRLPLESDPHERTFMQWPAIKTIYGSKDDLDAVREKIALIASTIARFEPVVLLARPEQAEDAKHWVKGNVEIWPLAVQDLWCRDSGPTFVVNDAGEMAVSELGFNGWGEKQPHADDAKVARRVAEKLGFQVFDNGIKGEGGGVEVDGAGTVLAHASCWVNPNRNSGTQEEVEEATARRTWRRQSDLGTRCNGRRHHRLSYRRSGSLCEARASNDPVAKKDYRW